MQLYPTKKAPIRASFIHIFHGVPHLTGQPTGFFAAWLRLLSVLSTQGLEPRCNCRNRPRTKCIGFRGGGESNPRYTNARYSPSSYHIRKKLYVIVPSEHGTKTMPKPIANPLSLLYGQPFHSAALSFLFGHCERYRPKWVSSLLENRDSTLPHIRIP